MILSKIFFLTKLLHALTKLQREITLIELAPYPFFFLKSTYLVYINMFAKFDEIPAMTLQDIKDGCTDGQTT